MAVLPTPGSPMSTGLFFVLRERMRVTARISESRPMTGSSLFWRAISTRSTPYFLSASYWDSGESVVTRWLPRTSLRAASTDAVSRPAFCRIRAVSERLSPSSMARSRCSTETYSSLRRRAWSSALTIRVWNSWDT